MARSQGFPSDPRHLWRFSERIEAVNPHAGNERKIRDDGNGYINMKYNT